MRFVVYNNIYSAVKNRRGKEFVMKKIALICILILTICLLCSSFAFAETPTQQTFYIANENVNVYASINNSWYQSLIIPKSYYFRVLTQGPEYSEIVYNKNTDYGVKLYVKTSDINSKCSVTKDEVSDDTAFYSIPDVNITAENPYFYTPDNMNEGFRFRNYKVERVLGVMTYNNQIFFAGLQSEDSVFGIYMFKATDTNKTDFSLAAIPLHPNTVANNNNQGDDIISTPSDDVTNPVQNNVIRNIMIAVICVLCVLVIFLIFRPTKNAKNRYEMDARENPDRRYDDPNGGYDRRG